MGCGTAPWISTDFKRQRRSYATAQQDMYIAPAAVRDEGRWRGQRKQLEWAKLNVAHSLLTLPKHARTRCRLSIAYEQTVTGAGVAFGELASSGRLEAGRRI